MFAHAACVHDWPGDHHWFTISVWWQSQILAATIGSWNVLGNMWPEIG